MATYYVRVDTYWQNSTDYFVGPFSDRQAAERWLDAGRCGNGINLAGHFATDIKHDWRACVISATEAKRWGMSYAYDSYNVLPTTTQPSADGIESAVRLL